VDVLTSKSSQLPTPLVPPARLVCRPEKHLLRAVHSSQHIVNETSERLKIGFIPSSADPSTPSRGQIGPRIQTSRYEIVVYRTMKYFFPQAGPNYVNPANLSQTSRVLTRGLQTCRLSANRSAELQAFDNSLQTCRFYR